MHNGFGGRGKTNDIIACSWGNLKTYCDKFTENEVEDENDNRR